MWDKPSAATVFKLPVLFLVSSKEHVTSMAVPVQLSVLWLLLLEPSLDEVCCALLAACIGTTTLSCMEMLGCSSRLQHVVQYESG